MSAVILFDGVCNFCNSSVNFIIERDGKGYFKFAPLQSEIGEQYLDKFSIDPNETDSEKRKELGRARAFLNSELEHMLAARKRQKRAR